MKSHLYHIQINIDFKNLSFYKDLMEFMGWNVIFESPGVIGYKSGSNGDIWFVKADKTHDNNYDGPGMNHISLRVEQILDVDKLTAYLEKNNVKTLFGTPKHRPEFASSLDETYYQIMFESPDKILFEVVFIGPKKK